MGPRLAFEPSKVDFGAQPRGPTLQGAFKLKNVGDKPLEIQRVETSCGCLAATYDKVVIQPGEQFEFGFFLDTTTLTDSIIKLFLNDPTQPVVILPIHIRVLDEIQIDGMTLAFGRVPQGGLGAATVTVLANRQNLTFRILSLTSTLKNVRLRAKPILEPERVGYDVVGRLDASGMPLGPFWGKISIELDLPKRPVVSLDISGEVISGLVFSPNPLAVSVRRDRLPLAQPLVATLRSASGHKFKVSRVETDWPYLTAAQDNRAAAAAHRLYLNLKPDAPATPRARKTAVKVFTDTRPAPYVATAFVRIADEKKTRPARSGGRLLGWCAALAAAGAALTWVLRRRGRAEA